MATDKKFAVAGVSTIAGDTKIRFANDMMRTKILQKNGHTDIDLVELPTEMSKAEIVQHLKSIEFGQGNAATEAALALAEKKNPSTSKTVKAKTSTKVKATVSPVSEDAPF